MKKLVRVVSVALLAVMALALLASCAPSGKYGDASGLAGVEYKFAGSKVTVTLGVAGFEKSFKGTFKMGKDDDGNKTITFKFTDKEASSYTGTFSYGEGKDDNGKYITIGSVKYYKQ